MKSKSELEFEKEVINYLTKIGGTKQWEYLHKIKTTEGLWNNFKSIIEQNNFAKLDKPLSENEFNQVKKIISNLNSPYKAGQFLYGVNGVSEIEIDLDNGKHIFLNIFDQAKVGGGSTIYQIVNQIERANVINGKNNRRFDITLLINGLPILQIELKRAMQNIDDALNQMKQYIGEKQYTDIFSTLQILIAMSPHEIKYMANTTLDKFNKTFAFRWHKENEPNPVTSWKIFGDEFLSIPMAHDMATRFMILDGTKNKETLKVMRYYQVYATRNIIDKVQRYSFNERSKRLGYIWHTTGSGKTITSFKTAWLASKLPNVSKVIFLVDRIALTNQTTHAYRAYDPNSSFGSGVVADTSSVFDLHKKLNKKSDKNIVVTSIQKMARYAKQGKINDNDNYLFIVDEAHRSTGNDADNFGMINVIKNTFIKSAWIGYTGTPRFPETSEIFGERLHAYTIKEAIADRNVLGFNVEFKETVAEPTLSSETKFDENLIAAAYDKSEEHLEIVVKDILDNWKIRSCNKKYNAIFTVHVSGVGASIPRAFDYYFKFIEIMNQRPIEERLNIAISVSQDTSNGELQYEKNERLNLAITNYDNIFKTKHDMKMVKEYKDDITRRLNKTADDGNYLDLVIVVDQLLTGFDAPELNCLYVDRVLTGANLIQAYSRTNRVENFDNKPWGNVINYRFPKRNELEMNKALATYSNRDKAEQLSLKELQQVNEEDGILSKKFGYFKGKISDVVDKLYNLTNGFQGISLSEKEQEESFELIKEYNSLINKMKQFTVDDLGNEISAYSNGDEFLNIIGITKEEEIKLTSTIFNQLKEYRAKKEDIDISEVDFNIVHVHDVRINYDYLIDLLARIANEVHEDEVSKIDKTYVEIKLEVDKIKNDNERKRINEFVDKIISNEYEFDSYPVSNDFNTIEEGIKKSLIQSNLRLTTDFIRKFGLDNAITPKKLEVILQEHKYGMDDLDNQGLITEMINLAREDYSGISGDEIKNLSWSKYRLRVREELKVLADEVKKYEK
ncbi:MAG: HsdR family type I site-specific deoxyribonuclease [bacterium]